MSRLLRIPTWCAAALTLACGDATTPDQSPVFSISPAIQWSRGVITVSSSAFEGVSAPVLVAGAETLAVSPVDDSTVTATLPLGSSGPLALELVRGSERLAVGTVQRVGFNARNDIAPGFFAGLVSSDAGGSPVVLGFHGVHNSVQTLDLRTGDVTEVSRVRPVGVYGLSPSFRPGFFVVEDSANGRILTRLDPLPLLQDTSFHQPQPQASRHQALLHPGIQLLTSATAIWTADSTQLVTFIQASPYAVLLSPDASIATVSASGVLTGTPVYDGTTGDTLYTLGPGRRNCQWAAFSPDGATIYFLVGPLFRPDSILAVTARTGRVQQAVRLPDGVASHVIADPVQPLLYVEFLMDSLPQVLVYQTSDLQLVGQMEASPPAWTVGGLDGTMAIDRARNLLYLVWSHSGNAPMSPVWTFDLVP
jgi:hypothetical protein